MLLNQLLYRRAGLMEHSFSVLKGIIQSQVHPVDILLPLRRLHRQEGQMILILHFAVPCLIEFSRYPMEVIADRLPEMAASGMDHDTQKSILILLQLNKMIAAPQTPHLKVTVIDQGQKLRILFIFFHLLFCQVKHRGFLRRLIPLRI